MPACISAVIRLNHVQDSRRSYWCIKFLVNLVNRCSLVKNDLQQTKSKWQWAVNWLKKKVSQAINMINISTCPAFYGYGENKKNAVKIQKIPHILHANHSSGRWDKWNFRTLVDNFKFHNSLQDLQQDCRNLMITMYVFGRIIHWENRTVFMDSRLK